VPSHKALDIGRDRRRQGGRRWLNVRTCGRFDCGLRKRRRLRRARRSRWRRPGRLGEAPGRFDQAREQDDGEHRWPSRAIRHHKPHSVRRSANPIQGTSDSFRASHSSERQNQAHRVAGGGPLPTGGK
jgi:hypothetical protein